MKFGIFLFAVAAFAQPATPIATQQVYILSGSNVTAICESPSTQTYGLRTQTRVAISAVSKANPGIVTSVGHGFDTGGRPKVTISGATGTGWVSGSNTI